MQIIKVLFSLLLICCTANVFADGVAYNKSAMEQYVSAPKKYTFKEVCKQGESSNHYCVTDFSSANVQMYQAIGLAQIYIQNKYGKSAECSPVARTSWNDDYIKCTTTDNNSFFEFKFDDVRESWDQAIQESIWKSVCQLHGGKVDTSHAYTRPCSATACSISRNEPSVAKDMKEFGYDAHWVEASTSGPGYCTATFNKKRTLRTAYGLDNKVFASYQMRAVADINIILKRYAEAQLKKANQKLTSFRCDKGFTHYLTGALDNLKDDVLTCYVNGKPVDFVFDDLSESQNSLHEGALDGLNCVLDQGGIFDGEFCYGLSKIQCDKLANDPDFQSKGKVVWNDNLESCTLELFAASKAATINTINRNLAGVGATVGFAVLSYATAGGATWFLIVGTGMAVTGQTTAEVIKKIERNDTQEFLRAANECSTTACAKDYLRQFLSAIRDYQGNIPEQMEKAVDETLSVLLEKIDDEQFFVDLASKIEPSERSKWLNRTLTASVILTVAGDLVSLYPGLAKNISKLGKIKLLEKTGMALMTKANKYPKVLKLLKATGKTYDRAIVGFDASSL